MNVMKQLKALCTPAFIYFILSALAYISMVIQNIGNRDKFCFGKKTCRVPSTLLLFVWQALYIGAWTFGLNWLCSKGYSALSWTILFFPLIVMFLTLMALFFVLEEAPKSVEISFDKASSELKEKAKNEKGEMKHENLEIADFFGKIADDMRKKEAESHKRHE